MSAYVLTGPRVAYAMARCGPVPGDRGQALTAMGHACDRDRRCRSAGRSFSCGLLPFERLLMYSSVGLAIFSMLTVTLVCAAMEAAGPRPPVRLPGLPDRAGDLSPGERAPGCGGFRERPWASLGSLAIMLAGVPFYLVWTHFTKPRANPA